MKIVGINIDVRGNRHRLIFGLPIVEHDGEWLRPSSMQWARVGGEGWSKLDPADAPSVFANPVEIANRDQIGVAFIGGSYGTATLREEIRSTLANRYSANVAPLEVFGGPVPPDADWVAMVVRPRLLEFRKSFADQLLRTFDRAIALHGPTEIRAAFENISASGAISHDDYLVLRAVVAVATGDHVDFRATKERAQRRNLTGRVLLELRTRGLNQEQSVRSKDAAAEEFDAAYRTLVRRLHRTGRSNRFWRELVDTSREGTLSEFFDGRVEVGQIKRARAFGIVEISDRANEKIERFPASNPIGSRSWEHKTRDTQWDETVLDAESNLC